MRELEYPFDGEQILKKSKKIKRALLEERSDFLEKRIAVLGGSTTVSNTHMTLPTKRKV